MNPPTTGSGPDTWYAPPTPAEDWTSSLWSRADTVAGAPTGPVAPAGPASAEWPVGPPAGTAPSRQSRSVLLAGIVAVLVALLVIGGALAGLWPRNASDTALAPRPTPTAPAAPVVPAPAPTPAPSTPSTPPSTAPNQNPSGSGATLTPQQASAAAAVTPGLVDIESTIGYQGQRGAGTGIVIGADGVILTNHHVVAGSTAITVTAVQTGRQYSATVLGYDKTHDIAVLRLAGASGLTTAPLGDSGQVAVGDSIVAVGNAGGAGGTPSAVGGRVTALDQAITAQDAGNGTSQRLTGLIQVDAPIRPGDSGGALAAVDGTVVGVITAGSVASGGSSVDGQTTATQGYAVPLATAQEIADQILAGRSSSTVHIGGTAFLGVSVTSLGAGLGGLGGLGGALGGLTGGDGVSVSQVIPGSAAEKAGLAAGDVITAVDGTPVATGTDLTTALGTHHPGDTVTVSWTDASGAARSASVRLGSGPVG